MKVFTKPIINPDGGSFQCQEQEAVVRKQRLVCEVCIQITGRGRGGRDKFFENKAIRGEKWTEKRKTRQNSRQEMSEK